MITTKHLVAKVVEVPFLQSDTEARRIICPQHGFRLGKLCNEKRKEGALVSMIVKCPRCGYKERRVLSQN